MSIPPSAVNESATAPLQERVKSFLAGRSIVVLEGGRSSENKVSRITSAILVAELRKMGFDVELVDIDNDLGEVIGKIRKGGLVFLGLHGGLGENGSIQGLLEFLNVPYTGSGIMGSAIGMNKLVSKELLESHGILSPPYLAGKYEGNGKAFVEKVRTKLGYPVMVKIIDEGSGHGVFKADDDLELERILHKINNSRKVIVEKFIKGREISVGMIQRDWVMEILPILEAVYEGDYFDATVRNNPEGYKRVIIDDQLPSDLTSKIKEQAKLINIVLNANAYSRIDFRLEDNTNNLYFLEITTLPGITEYSWLPLMLKEGGYGLNQFILMLMATAIERYEKK